MAAGKIGLPPVTAEEWNAGRPDVMAVALHRLYGLPLMAEFGAGPDGEGREVPGRLSHAWVRLPDGRALDAAGPRPVSGPAADAGREGVPPGRRRTVELRDDDPCLPGVRATGGYGKAIAAMQAIPWIRANLGAVAAGLGLEIADVWSTLAVLDRAGDEVPDLAPWRRGPAGPEQASRRPLLVIVHPGDAIEAEWRGYGCHGGDVLRQSMACQDGMGAEIRALLDDGWDAAVLHRRSCGQFHSGKGARHVSGVLRAALEGVHRRGAVLYGDDTDAAVTWLDGHMGLRQRPAIHLTGAYADPGTGCVTATGQGIVAILHGCGAAAEVTVSASAYPGPGQTAIWQPPGPAGLSRAV
jgi:hypothetical protein